LLTFLPHSLTVLSTFGFAQVELYRNGEKVEGAVAAGFSGDYPMWLAACVPDDEWTATWTFPNGCKCTRNLSLFVIDGESLRDCL